MIGLRAVGVQRLDVRGREHLEDVLVAHPPGRIARCTIPPGRGPRSGPRRLEAGHDRARDAAVALVERGRAADPVEALQVGHGVRSGRRDLGGGRHREGQAAGPVESRARGLAPGVAVALHRGERGVQLLREAPLLEDEVATQADDLVDVLDEHRAGLDAGATGHAVPHRVVRDRGVDDAEVVAAVAPRCVRRLDPGDERQARLGFDRHLAHAHDHRLGVERLARGPGRACVLAAPALGAREPVEQVLPAEVRDGLDPEACVLGLEVHRGQLAARRELAERRVEEGRGDVQVLRARQVDEERGDDEDVRPEEDRVAGVEHGGVVPGDGGEGNGEGIRRERPGGVGVAVARDPERLGEAARSPRRRRSAAG